MAGPENLQSDEYEAALMRSDLAELFQTNIEQAAVRQPFDLHDPAEVILGGTYETPGQEALISTIQVRQRVDERGLDYVIVISEKNYNYWFQITDSETRIVWPGRPQMTFDDMAAVRWRIRPGQTKWDRELSEKLTDDTSPYRMANRFV